MEDKNVFNLTNVDNMVKSKNRTNPTIRDNIQIGLVKDLFYEELIIINNYESRDVS